MKSPKTLILSGYGLNCEIETAQACRLAGGQEVDIVHLSRLVAGDIRLNDYHFLVFIGGFLDGDDLGAGRVGANRWKYSRIQTTGQRLQDDLSAFIESGKLMLGICNGFQMMVKLGVLPGDEAAVGPQRVSLTTNLSGRFEDRWVTLQVDLQSPCVFTQGFTSIYLPVRHGEGRLEGETSETLADLLAAHQAPLLYTDPQGKPTEAHPFNPNGSPLGIAALCNPKGNVMGLMPHPEAYQHYTNHPQWTRRPYLEEEGEGLQFFRNAYRYFV